MNSNVQHPYVDRFWALALTYQYHTLYLKQSVACYGTNFDQSTHLPRVSVDSDEYLFNADSKLVDSFWYYHFGEETLDFNSQGDTPLRMMARPKGKLNPPSYIGSFPLIVQLFRKIMTGLS